MKKILVPCDFSAASEEAFKFAVKIARQSGGEIIVLFILDITLWRGNPTLSHSYAFNLNFLKEMEREADEKFLVMREKFAPKTLPVKFTQKIGTLVPGIASFVIEKEIDLVVMGTRENVGLRPRTSNTQLAIRNCSVPVIAIRKDTDTQIKTIVVPIIPGQRDEKFLHALKALQSFFKANIHLLWVNTPDVFKSDPTAREEILHYAENSSLDNYTVNIRSDDNPDAGILHFASEVDADMIAMGTHAWKGFIHLIAGSITENVAGQADLPVWSVGKR